MWVDTNSAAHGACSDHNLIKVYVGEEVPKTHAVLQQVDLRQARKVSIRGQGASDYMSSVKERLPHENGHCSGPVTEAVGTASVELCSTNYSAHLRMSMTWKSACYSCEDGMTLNSKAADSKPCCYHQIPCEELHKLYIVLQLAIWHFQSTACTKLSYSTHHLILRPHNLPRH